MSKPAMYISVVVKVFVLQILLLFGGVFVAPAVATDATAYGWAKGNLDVPFNTFEISPHDSKVIFAGTEDLGVTSSHLDLDGSGLFKSNDGGVTWFHFWGDDRAVVRAIAISHQDSMKMFIGAPSGRDTFGFFTTSNGGETWQKIAVELGVEFVQTIAIHPQNDNVILAGTEQGIIKSADGGLSWNLASDGLQGESGDLPWVQKIVYAPSDPNVILALTDKQMQFQSLSGFPAKMSEFTRYSNQRQFALQNNDVEPGIFRSNDSGNSWHRIELLADQAPSQIFYDIAIHPTDVDLFYVGSRDGLYRTEDGGHSFAKLSDALDFIWTVTIDLEEPQILYVGRGILGGCLRSIDGGQSWNQIFNRFIASEQEAGVSAIRIDPNNRNLVYLSGRLVWNFYRKIFNMDLRRGDFNEDGKVDFDDFLLFANHFHTKPGRLDIEKRFDLNDDEKVNFLDFVMFAKEFLG